MDIKKTTKNKKSIRQYQVAALAVLSVIAFSGWQWRQPSAAEKVERSQIWSDQIRQGDLALQVEGYGKLKSKLQRLLTTPANATVDEILLKPGAMVTADSVILRLTIEQARLQQLSELHREVLAIQQEKINQQQEQLAVISERFDKLTVRAGINGVL